MQMPPAWRKRQTIAEQHEGPQRDEQWPGRLQQQPVDRGGVLQAIIGHRVVGREAGEGEDRHQARMPADRRPIAHEVRCGERQQDQECAAPADERERYRRNMPGNEAAENGVAGPEQRSERQQQIGLVG
jgi:hypothetical protein